MYEDMTVAQLQTEIARMQAEVSRRVCGDPRVSVTRHLKVGADDTAHVCGLQGFGQAGDECPACVRPNY